MDRNKPLQRRTFKAPARTGRRFIVESNHNTNKIDCQTSESVSPQPTGEKAADVVRAYPRLRSGIPNTLASAVVIPKRYLR
jgi:hypothetical protein